MPDETRAKLGPSLDRRSDLLRPSINGVQSDGRCLPGAGPTSHASPGMPCVVDSTRDASAPGTEMPCRRSTCGAAWVHVVPIVAGVRAVALEGFVHCVPGVDGANGARVQQPFEGGVFRSGDSCMACASTSSNPIVSVIAVHCESRQRSKSHPTGAQSAGLGSWRSAIAKVHLPSMVRAGYNLPNHVKMQVEHAVSDRVFER